VLGNSFITHVKRELPHICPDSTLLGNHHIISITVIFVLLFLFTFFILLCQMSCQKM
jgi:hypothetical protein